MIALEKNELLIKHYAIIIDRFLDFETDLERFNFLNDARFSSLKADNIKKDIASLVEFDAVLQRIQAIARKPHLFVMDNDIILRNEEISTFSNEKFQKTLKQSSLWKQKNTSYSPEYAYAVEYIDNLQIYENILVKMCLDRIESLLRKGLRFYTQFIGDLSGFPLDDYSYTSLFNPFSKKAVEKSIFQDNVDVKIIIERLEVVIRKIRYIKKSNFYKALQGAKPIDGPIVVTNILRDNRSYNYVLRFYRRLVKATNSSDLMHAKRAYMLRLILKALKSHAFILDTTEMIFYDDDINLHFTNELFTLSLTQKDTKPFNFLLTAKSNPQSTTLSTIDIFDEGRIYKNDEHISGYEYIYDEHNLYRLFEDELLSLKIPQGQKEIETVTTLIASLINTFSGNANVYERYCPICSGRTLISEEQRAFSCLTCRSEYAFVEDAAQKALIWIKKLSMEDGAWKR